MDAYLTVDQLSQWVEQAIQEFAESDLVGVSPAWQSIFRAIPQLLAAGEPADDRFRWEIEAANETLPDIVDRLHRLRRYLMRQLHGKEFPMVEQLIHWFDRTELDIVERMTGKTSTSHSLSEPYETIFWNARDGMYISTIDGRFVHCNEAMVKMLGYQTVDDVLKLDIAEELYLDQEDRKVMVEHLHRDGFFDRHEFCFRCADGSERIALESCYQVTSRTGESYVVGMLVDVTDEKSSQARTQSYIHKLESQAMEAGVEANRELKRSESLLEVSDHPLLIVDSPELTLMGCNNAFLKIFGYRKKDVEDLPLKRIFSESGWMEIFPKLSDLRRKSRFHVRDVTCITQDSEDLKVDLTILVHHDHSGTSLFIEVQDRSDFKALTDQAQLIRHQLDMVLDEAPLGMIGFNGEGKVVFVNRWLRSSIGYSKERMRNSDFINDLFTIPEQRVKFNKYVQAMLSGRKYENLPISLRSRTGETLDFAIKTSVFDFFDGTGRGFLAFLRPIGIESTQDETDELRTRDELIEQLGRQAETARADQEHLTQLMNLLIDQLKNPLEVISGFTSLLHREIQEHLTDSQREDFSIIVANLEILTRLMDQAHEYERLHHQKVTPRPILISASGLASFLNDAFVGFGERLTQDHSGADESMIKTDPLIVESALRQFLENASTHTAGPFSLHWESHDGQPTIVISDQGPGMNLIDLEHAHDAFYTNNPDKPSAGLGVGLTIAHGYANLLHVACHIESSVKAGTQVFWSFPAGEHE
ncbi:MAG: PAS domain S-box protein [Acidobacteria bacterium]|nr:PAS domain S-box protein [Acidobacteriota bacterium]